MSLELKQLGFSYSGKQVLNDINLAIGDGEIVSLLGKNGAGKTTLFKCMLGFLKYRCGSVMIDEKDIKQLDRKEIARSIAYIPQSFNPVFGHSVLDCVLMGYANVLGTFERPSDEHVKNALQVLRTLGIEDLAHKSCTKISGGEKSLMLMARAMIQGAKILVMDETTANLDLANIKKIMDIIRSLAENGYSVVFSTHDPNLAVHYSSRVVVLKNGSVFADVKPDKLDVDTLTKVYETEIDIAPGFRAKL